MPLFDPARHEPLTALPWDDGVARAALERIVHDTREAWGGPEDLWPIHPTDVSDERPDVLTPLYHGAAGVIWALHHLGVAEADQHLPALRTLSERCRADSLRLQGEVRPSFGLGEAGILLIQWRLDPHAATADALADAIVANMNHPAPGWAWGSAGTLQAALFMHDATGDARWADLFRQGADILWETWFEEPATGAWVWTQDLYGEKHNQLGGLHGLASVAHTLLAGRHLLPEARRAELIARVQATLARTALTEGDLTNWPFEVGKAGPKLPRVMFVQHCVGAPGVINGLAALPADPEVDALFLAAGELIWTAGPVAKAPGLCHGTPGNGYALLKLFHRTGDDLWLARARRFAMHAIGQGEAWKHQYGQRKFSLWTGDLGLACFVADCLEARSEIPTFDII